MANTADAGSGTAEVDPPPLPQVDSVIFSCIYFAIAVEISQRL